MEPVPGMMRKDGESAKNAPAAPVKSGAYDRELVRRAQGDDKEAYEELVRRHQQRVLAVASGILRRHEDVEDIAQQVFVKAYFSLKRFDGRRSARGCIASR
jgi:hypothetical protein